MFLSIIKIKVRLMANILGENKFLIFLRGISPVSRFLSSIFFLVFLFFFTFLFFYNPVNSKINQQKLLFKDLNNQNNLLCKTSKELKILENKHELFLKDYKGISEKNFFFSKTLNVSSEKMDFFFKSIKKYSLKCLEFKPAGKSKKQTCKRYYYTLKIKGNFNNFVSFFNDINKTAGSLKFKNIDIQSLEKGNILFFTKIRLIKFIKSEEHARVETFNVDDVKV